MTFVPDVRFMRGMNTTVSIERDLNGGGLASSQHAGYEPDYQPVAGMAWTQVGGTWQPVSGIGTTPCRLIRKGGSARDQSGSPGAQRSWSGLFGTPVALDLTYRLAWADPDRPGKTIYLYVDADSNNAHGMMHHWNVSCVEFIA